MRTKYAKGLLVLNHRRVQWERVGWSTPMTIGFGGSIGTTPPGSEIRRCSWIADAHFLMDRLHCWKNVGIWEGTLQNNSGSHFRRRDGRRPNRYGVQLPNHERSALPLLKVLPLLTREHQEGGNGALNEGTRRPLRVGSLRSLFLHFAQNKFFSYI